MLVKKYLSFSFFLFSFTSSLLAQNNNSVKLIKEVSYSIINGNEGASDSLQKELLVNYSNESNEITEILKGLHLAFFHYDYSLDSLYELHKKYNTPYISHLQKLLESEYYFNNADWMNCGLSSLDFTIEEQSLDSTLYSPLFDAISLSNLIISRQNSLLRNKSDINDNYFKLLNTLFKNSADSLNNAMLIKLFWASCIVNSTSKEANQLQDILWKKKDKLSIEDRIYYESIVSEYFSVTKTFYANRNNAQLYDSFSQRILLSNKIYFIQNRWFNYLLTFAKYNDLEHQSKYLDIELKYSKEQKKITPYFQGQRLIQMGVYYGNKDLLLSSSYFLKFYNLSYSDSVFWKRNYMFFNYTRFKEALIHHEALLIPLIESQKLINENNSEAINYEYIGTYFNQLLLKNQFHKVDSLLKFDTIISSLNPTLISSFNIKFLHARQKILDSFSIENYFLFKNEFLNLNIFYSDLSKVLNQELIEYAAYFNDIPFADSLLNNSEILAFKHFDEFDKLRLNKADIPLLIKNDYLDRFYIMLFNKTQDNNYLIRLLRFVLQKNNLIEKIISSDQSNQIIDSLSRNILNDDIIKTFGFITNTFDSVKSNPLILNRTTKNISLRDSLSLELKKSNLINNAVKPLTITQADSSILITSFFNNLNDSSVILMGVASHKHPLDSVLSTYILMVEKDVKKLRLLNIEDSLFTTPLGNYFDAPVSSNSATAKFKFLLNNLKNSPAIQTIKNGCENKSQIFITGGALIDQIPFNIVLSEESEKNFYQISNLHTFNTSLYSRISGDRNILAVGGVKFNSTTSSTTRNLLNYLPETLKEVNIIDSIFKNNYQVKILKEDYATKSELINQINQRQYEIIHLATHSFYSPFDNSNNPFVKIPVSILPQREFRSVILFANGGEFQKFESTKRLEEFINKNLLLAEIPFLPINKTRLVVLSSCETNINLPTVYGDIYGNHTLNTAFKYAGAQYVIGSRWEISDKFSKQFFIFFYGALNASDDIEASFFYAVKKLKELNPDPFIWGPFVLLK